MDLLHFFILSYFRKVRYKKMKHRLILEDIKENSRLMSMAEVQTEFEAYKKSRGVRQTTIRFYDNTLDAFYKFKDYKDPVSSITEDTISDYIQYCRDVRGNKENTISTYIRGLRTVLYYAMKKGYMEGFKIRLPAPDLTPKETYDLEEVQKLLCKPDLSNCSFSSYIAWVAENLFVYTGCRLSTAINIKCADIDFENNLIYYRHTKNKKPHTVPLVGLLKDVLFSHFKLLESQRIDTEYVLVDVYGGRITRGKLYRYISGYNRKRGVQKTSIHAFRRFYIKSLVIQGVPIPKIMYLVQHSSPEQIILYTKLYSTDLTDDVQKFADNIKPVKSSNTRKINLKKKDD